MARRTGPPLWLLGGLTLVLAAVVWRQWFEIDDVASGSNRAKIRASDTEQGPTTADEFKLADLASFDEIVTRPLFFASRRPPEAAPPPEQVAAPITPPNVVLTGTVISPEERLALLAVADVARPVRAVEGQEIGGWRIDQVLANSVILRQGEQSHEVTLRKGAPGNQAAQMPAVQPGADRTQIVPTVSDGEPSPSPSAGAAP